MAGPVSQQCPKSCPRNNANVCLVLHRSFPTSKGGMSAVSLFHSSFLGAISAVMLWPLHVQKAPQASKHLCPAKLYTGCYICCACQSVCPFIPTDSAMARTVDQQKPLQSNSVHGCVPFGAAHPRLHFLQQVHRD